jgi:hypothetical protein
MSERGLDWFHGAPIPSHGASALLVPVSVILLLVEGKQSLTMNE